jgi:hypothetical protein
MKNTTNPYNMPLSYFKNTNIIIFILFLIVMSSGCSYPATLPLRQGDEVRVTSTESDLDDVKMIYSSFTYSEENKPHQERFNISYQNLDQLKVKRGKKTAFLHGLAGGLFIGVMVGTMAPPGDGSNGFNRMLGGSIGAIIGLPIGGLIGLIIPLDRWKEIPLNDLKLTLMPNGGGAVGIGITFKISSN